MSENGKAGARTLAVDIGGTGVKVMTLADNGEPCGERERVDTPKPATPPSVLEAIIQLAKKTPAFDRVSVGFPGVVRDGITETAVNLDPTWIGFNLAGALADRLGKPVRVANDADVQGYGAIEGKGVELVLTLGTGLGSALFCHGRLVPNLEVAHHRFRAGKTYEETVGKAALERFGKKRWNKELLRVIEELEQLFNHDWLYLGGGNTKKIAVELPPRTKVVPNVAGLLGGIALWRENEMFRG